MTNPTPLDEKGRTIIRAFRKFIDDADYSKKEKDTMIDYLKELGRKEFSSSINAFLTELREIGNACQYQQGFPDRWISKSDFNHIIDKTASKHFRSLVNIHQTKPFNHGTTEKHGVMPSSDGKDKTDEDICICSEGIHDGNKIDCSCECHNEGSLVQGDEI